VEKKKRSEQRKKKVTTRRGDTLGTLTEKKARRRKTPKTREKRGKPSLMENFEGREHKKKLIEVELFARPRGLCQEKKKEPGA